MPKQRSAAFVLSRFPPCAEDHVAPEVRALQSRGLDILLVSLRRDGTSDAGLSGVAHLPLPDHLWRQPWRILSAWFRVRRWAGYKEARQIWWADLRRDLRPHRILLFGQALVLARELPERFAHLHACSLAAPATVSRYAAAICGGNWTCSAHATDTWTTREWEKCEKLADCRWLVACTAIAARELQDLAPAPGRVELVYHGIDFSRLPAAPARPPRNGSNPADPVLVLSVGRAVEKKGYDTLLGALGSLRDLEWRFVHIGDGPLIASLKAKAEELGVAGRIEWLGALSRDAALPHYRRADLFALVPRVMPDGDRDGMPPSLLMAQSQGLACVATDISGIPELITHGDTGLLVPPDDPAALREALADLIRRPELRVVLGTAGEARARSRFQAEGGIERLAFKFGVPSQNQDPLIRPASRG